MKNLGILVFKAIQYSNKTNYNYEFKIKIYTQT